MSKLGLLLLLVASLGCGAGALKAADVADGNEPWDVIGLHVTPAMAPSVAGAFGFVLVPCVMALIIGWLLSRGQPKSRS
jgi:hypothetical protein